MILITTQAERGRTVVTIDGEFTSSDLAEVERVREVAQGKVVLKLGGLITCSDDGVSLLKRWMASGAELEHANPFLQMILRNEKRPSK